MSRFFDFARPEVWSLKCLNLLAFLLVLVLPGANPDALVVAQDKAAAKEKGNTDGDVEAKNGAVVKGKVLFDNERLASWDGKKLEIPLSEIETHLFETVEIPPVPFPENWQEMKPEERQKWVKEYEESEAGKQFISNREKLFNEAHTFDVKIEKSGNFVVYDVPAGIYGLQGRVDKEIDGSKFGFEVFGQIEVLKDVDQIVLDPIQVAVTPLLETGAKAPPIKVSPFDDKTELTIDTFKGSYLFVGFWITDSPSAVYQDDIQKMYVSLKGKYPLRLLSICVDEDRKSAIAFIVDKKLKEGSHGFTDGFDHRTIFDYGVRTIPSFWLIAPDGTISMSQFDFARAFHSGRDLSEIVANRIEGKDLPTAAEKEGDKEETKPAAETPDK